MTDLAKRWLASPHWGGWRWGMVDIDGMVFDGAQMRMPHRPGRYYTDNAIPDLAHPGTLAFLLEDVRRAWGRPSSINSPCYGRSCWSVQIQMGSEWPVMWDQYKGDTEAQALHAALMAAPEAE